MRSPLALIIIRSLVRIERELGIIEHNEENIMTDQEKLDADVAAESAALDAIEAEIAALKSQPGAGALDFTALDALVQRMQADAPAATQGTSASAIPDGVIDSAPDAAA